MVKIYSMYNKMQKLENCTIKFYYLKVLEFIFKNSFAFDTLLKVMSGYKIDILLDIKNELRE